MSTVVLYLRSGEEGREGEKPLRSRLVAPICEGAARPVTNAEWGRGIGRIRQELQAIALDARGAAVAQVQFTEATEVHKSFAITRREETGDAAIVRGAPVASSSVVSSPEIDLVDWVAAICRGDNVVRRAGGVKGCRGSGSRHRG